MPAEEWRERFEVFAYFNNGWEVFAPRNALWLRKRLGLQIRPENRSKCPARLETGRPGMSVDMTALVIAIAIIIGLVVLTYAWGLRHPGPRVTPPGDGVRRRREERELL